MLNLFPTAKKVVRMGRRTRHVENERRGFWVGAIIECERKIEHWASPSCNSKIARLFWSSSRSPEYGLSGRLSHRPCVHAKATMRRDIASYFSPTRACTAPAAPLALRCGYPLRGKSLSSSMRHPTVLGHKIRAKAHICLQCFVDGRGYVCPARNLVERFLIATTIARSSSAN